MINKKIFSVLIVTIVVVLAFLLLWTRNNEPNVPITILAEEKSKENIEEPILKVKEEIKAEKYKIVNRAVIVPLNIFNKSKIVLLTIDDGPSPRSLRIAEILKNHNAKAIFFINGMNDIKNPGVINEVYKEGFEIGNHTWSHLDLKKEKDIIVSEKEIDSNTELIIKRNGIPPKFFRAPYGDSNPYIRNYVKEKGMMFMDWSGSALDWTKSSEEKDIFVSNVMNNIHSGSIILIHEHPWSVANLDSLLTSLENDGYTFVDPNDIVAE